MEQFNGIINQGSLGGLSLVIRCHNEEANIEKSIRSLAGLTIKHEIVVILHRCTDRSAEIVKSLKEEGFPISITVMDLELTRPGFQTLVSPIDHLNSMMSHMNYYYNLARYRWRFRWDADMFATPELIELLNGLDLRETRPISYKIGCTIDDKINGENYLFNCLTGYSKFIFWDVPVFKRGMETIGIEQPLINSVTVKEPKQYWSNEPWFFGKDEELERKYKSLEHIVGPEPVGMAAAQNSICDQYQFKVMENEHILSLLGINLYK